MFHEDDDKEKEGELSENAVEEALEEEIDEDDLPLGGGDSDEKEYE